MKSRVCFATVLTTAMLLSTFSPFVIANPIDRPSEFESAKTITIPESTAMTVIFPEAIEIDVKQEQPHPLTLFLAQPITDESGDILIPEENSLVKAQLIPTEKGAQIKVESIIVGSKEIPVQAISDVIPAVEVPLEKEAGHNFKRSAILGSALSVAVEGLDSQSIMKGALWGGGAAALHGMFSSKSVQLVSIPQGRHYILSFQASVKF